MQISYPRFCNYVMTTIWAITQAKLQDIVMFAYEKAVGADISAEEIAARVGKPKPRVNSSGSVGVLNVYGVIAHRLNDQDISSPGGVSIERLTSNFRSLVSDPNVKAIVLNIDSPGGSVAGLQELADEVFAAREQKHITAVANTMAASAAYWLASQASEFIVTPSGEVGSIGVYTAHQDFSVAMENAGIKTTFISAGKNKVEANMFEPLSDEARAAIQANVDAYYKTFVKSVARGRGTTVEAVEAGFGQGRMFVAKEALKAGMVDRIDTIDGVLSRLGASPSSSSKTGAQIAAIENAHLDLIL